MRFRLKAFGLHLAASASVLTLILGALYLGWYRWPGWYLTGVLRILGILILVDLLIGPTLTLLIANPLKARRALARDVAVIATTQIVALVYGASTLWHGRPLYYTFSVNSLAMVQASDLEAPEIALAKQQNPALAPHWYARPRWICAPLPENSEEATRIVNSVVLGGQDVVDMPRYYRPWVQCAAQLRENLKSLSDLTFLSSAQKRSLQQRMTTLGLSPDQRNAMILWGGGRPLLTVFDLQTLQAAALLVPDAR